MNNDTALDTIARRYSDPQAYAAALEVFRINFRNLGLALCRPMPEPDVQARIQEYLEAIRKVLAGGGLDMTQSLHGEIAASSDSDLDKKK